MTLQVDFVWPTKSNRSKAPNAPKKPLCRGCSQRLLASWAIARRPRTLGIIPRAQITKTFLSGQTGRVQCRGPVELSLQGERRKAAVAPTHYMEVCGGVESGSSETWEEKEARSLQNLQTCAHCVHTHTYLCFGYQPVDQVHPLSGSNFQQNWRPT